MESIIKVIAVYIFLLILIRVSGRRTMGEMTSFDFILLLILGEATEQALLDDDNSLTNSLLVIVTLITLDVGLAALKHKFNKVEKIVDGIPTILILDGEIKKENMNKSRIDEDDVMESARQNYGLGALKDIRHAILEKNGRISIIPYS